MTACLVLFLLSTRAFAGESEQTRRAREELERQLDVIVNIPNPIATISFMGLEEPPFELSEAKFVLDGKTLPTPALKELGKFQQTKIFRGEVAPGEHVLLSTVAWVDGGNMMFSETSGYTWKVTTRTTFTTQRGLETQILLTPEHDSGARERKDQFKLHSSATPVIIEVHEEPLSPPPLVSAEIDEVSVVNAPVSEVPDAGVAPVKTSKKKNKRVPK